MTTQTIYYLTYEVDYGFGQSSKYEHIYRSRNKACKERRTLEENPQYENVIVIPVECRKNRNNVLFHPETGERIKYIIT